MMFCNPENRAALTLTQTMIALSPKRRVIAWTLLGLFTALLCYFGFRGYLSAEMLMNFANAFYC